MCAVCIFKWCNDTDCKHKKDYKINILLSQNYYMDIGQPTNNPCYNVIFVLCELTE